MSFHPADTHARPLPRDLSARNYYAADFVRELAAAQHSTAQHTVLSWIVHVTV